jgi:hypothetical protein
MCLLIIQTVIYCVYIIENKYSERHCTGDAIVHENFDVIEVRKIILEEP